MQYSLAQTEQGETLGLTAKMANRHGLIAGATGTGKPLLYAKWQRHSVMTACPFFWWT